ncbi:MAG: hypothetical protein JTJ28_19630 [Lactobacillus sp.]|nr:hypothetical protein [Lactobacillus sp.]
MKKLLKTHATSINTVQTYAACGCGCGCLKASLLADAKSGTNKKTKVK